MHSYLKSLINYAPDLCQQLSLTESSTFLGNGVHGAVFVGGDNRVIKLTHSETEAEVSQVLIGRKLKNVVQIYSVHRVGNKQQWLICMEQLRKHRLGWKAMSHPDITSAKRTLKQLGFHHMDISPENIMRCPTTKRLKLIDFGCTLKTTLEI